MNKIYKKGDNLIIEIPLTEKRDNPYMPNTDVGDMSAIVGLITTDEHGNDEMGFSKMIDMSYKDKGDQWTSLFYHHWQGSPEEFEALCKKLGIGVVKESE